MGCTRRRDASHPHDNGGQGRILSADLRLRYRHKASPWRHRRIASRTGVAATRAGPVSAAEIFCDGLGAAPRLQLPVDVAHVRAHGLAPYAELIRHFL